MEAGRVLGAIGSSQFIEACGADSHGPVSQDTLSTITAEIVSMRFMNSMDTELWMLTFVFEWGNYNHNFLCIHEQFTGLSMDLYLKLSRGSVTLRDLGRVKTPAQLFVFIISLL